MKNISYIEKDKQGQEIIRYKKTHDPKIVKQQFDDFEKKAKEGKLLCLSDLLGNAGL